MSKQQQSSAGILEQSVGVRNRVVVPARQPMQPGGPKRKPYSYSFPSRHRFFKISALDSTPASSDTAKCEERQMKQCWIKYINIQNNPLLRNCLTLDFTCVQGDWWGWQPAGNRLQHNTSARPGSSPLIRYYQGVTKRCRLSCLTYSALVNEPKCGGRGGVAGSQPMSTGVHRSQKKHWRSNSVFNLWVYYERVSSF